MIVCIHSHSSPESSPSSHTGSKTSSTGSPSDSPTSGNYIYFYQGGQNFLLITALGTNFNEAPPPPSSSSSSSPPPPLTQTASDGQHLYVHPVNARCLVKVLHLTLDIVYVHVTAQVIITYIGYLIEPTQVIFIVCLFMEME